MMAAASLFQLCPWLDDISPLTCTGLSLSSGSSSQPQQHQPTATNSLSVHRLSAAEEVHSATLLQPVAGSISMLKEIHVVTPTNLQKRQIQMRVSVALQWLFTTVMCCVIWVIQIKVYIYCGVLLPAKTDTAGIVFSTRVCLRVIIAKYGPDLTYCSGHYHRGCSFGRFLYVCLSLVRFCQSNSIATVQDAVMKLYRCVVEMKMKVEFEDGCGPSKGARSSPREWCPYEASWCFMKH